MKVLWLSMTPGLLHEGVGTGNYGGSGWIASLQYVFQKYNKSARLALAYLTSKETESVVMHGIRYYPIYTKPKTAIQKFREYYGISCSFNRKSYIEQIKNVIVDFEPDIIHLFGIENPLSDILGNTDVPVVVHLQGILGPVDNAFYPPGFNKFSFLWPPTKRELITRNGFIYSKNVLHHRAKHESELFKKAQFFMGRTSWDFHISKLLSPKSIYYKVNEVLRSPFYNNAYVKQTNNSKLMILSTLSETVYKGLDLVLKSARILASETNIRFEWNVVGVPKESRFVRFVEKMIGVKSSDVCISYLGILNAKQLAEICKSSSVYVHPSYIDNSPNSICEAQMLGLPVIATNVGGVSSLIKHGETGILIPSNSPYELSYWLRELFYNKTLYEMLSNNGVSSAMERHDYETIYCNLMAAYNSILQNNNGQ